MDGDVTEIDTSGGPTLEQLQQQLKEQSENLSKLQQEREMFLQALAEKDAGRAAPPRAEAQDDEGELDPATKKALAKLQQQHATELNSVQDQFDEMSFLQYAASAGLDPELVAVTSKKYSDYRAGGVRVRGNDGKERPMTRADVLYAEIGKRTVAEQFKTAPEKNLNALKARLIGGAAGFEGTSPSGPDGRQYVKIDSEIDALPNKDKVSKLEKSLGKIEF